MLFIDRKRLSKCRIVQWAVSCAASKRQTVVDGKALPLYSRFIMLQLCNWRKSLLSGNKASDGVIEM